MPTASDAERTRQFMAATMQHGSGSSWQVLQPNGAPNTRRRRPGPLQSTSRLGRGRDLDGNDHTHAGVYTNLSSYAGT